MSADPTPRQEAERIVQVVGGDTLAAMHIVERQLNTLYSRAQVLVSFCGVVVTVTGFSGRLIAGTSPLAQALIVAGLGTVSMAAIWMFAKVMRVRWVTLDLGHDPVDMVDGLIQRRNLKTAAYSTGGTIVFVGLLLYFAAIALMLLNPEPMPLPVR